MTGAFGKVYKGELLEVVNASTLVAIKTLKPGAQQKTRNDFRREAELMSELRHPNIVLSAWGLHSRRTTEYDFSR